MEIRNSGVTADPLFVAVTRPPMRFGVTYVAILINAAVVMEVFLLTRNLLVLLLANLVDLTAIASLGSVVALAIFLVVSVAAFKLRAETGSRAWVLIAAIALTLVVVVVFVVETLRTEPETFVAMVGILLLATVLDQVWTRLRAGRAATR